MNYHPTEEGQEGHQDLAFPDPQPNKRKDSPERFTPPQDGTGVPLTILCPWQSQEGELIESPTDNKLFTRISTRLSLPCLRLNSPRLETLYTARRH